MVAPRGHGLTTRDSVDTRRRRWPRRAPPRASGRMACALTRVNRVRQAGEPVITPIVVGAPLVASVIAGRAVTTTHRAERQTPPRAGPMRCALVPDYMEAVATLGTQPVVGVPASSPSSGALSAPIAQRRQRPTHDEVHRYRAGRRPAIAWRRRPCIGSRNELPRRACWLNWRPRHAPGRGRVRQRRRGRIPLRRSHATTNRIRLSWPASPPGCRSA